MSDTRASSSASSDHAPAVDADRTESILTTTAAEGLPPADGKPPETIIELTDQTNRLPFRKLLPVFLGLALCVVVSTLDSVIVATALPTISAAFDAGSVVSWVPSAYLLTSTCFQPLYGRFSDIFGRKSALCLAMALFMFGNLLAGFSKTIVQLIVFRGFAGAGGGGLISMMQIVVSDLVSLRERGKYQGIIGAVVAVGYAIGPVVGGALAQHVGWRWCMWITIPISFVATCVVVFVLPLKAVRGDIRQKLLAIDYIGTILTLAGCALLMLPLIWGGVIFPWTSSVVLAPLVSGFVVVGLFCFWEWKGARLPIVPSASSGLCSGEIVTLLVHIFKHSTVTGVLIAMFVNGFVFFSSLYYLPQFFQAALGFSPLKSGIFLVPMLVTLIMGSWGAGVIVSRTGRYRAIIYAGFSIWSVACGVLSTVNARTSKAELVVLMMLAGIGGGGTMQTTTVAAQASVPRRDMSVVTVMRNFLRLLGGTLSLAVASTIVNNSLQTSMNSLHIAPAIMTQIIDNPALLHSPESINLSADAAAEILAHGYIKGFNSLFIMHVALTVSATFVSVVLIKHKELTRGDDEALKQKAIQEERVRKLAKATLRGVASGAVTPRDLESGTVTPHHGFEMSRMHSKEV
ncbi:unnamed protein product [Mycena citricolor]|uniref:Major facilitator superfamily (MFS) profile domain-containing protein n=1 Tax=Mycena citricolor TaxID=2018698 RepID=A0AAD2GT03_9AGAR|nr:unnamed protein product [Mycena citricolor]